MILTLRPWSAEDLSHMARLRATHWGDLAYWEPRVEAYFLAKQNPQHALAERMGYVAIEDGTVVGFIAGHITRRYGCQGEIEWLNVDPNARRTRVGSKLLRLMGAWFAERDALRVCVDVEPSNATARAFYRKHGAVDLRPSWLVWNDVRVITKE